MKINREIIAAYFKLGIKPKLLARNKSKELSLVSNNLEHAKKAHCVGIVVFRNEKVRLPYFLDYYRKLGVGHFIFIDNESTDGGSDYLSQFDDCSVFLAKGSYADSRFGLHWVNYLLDKYCRNKWILHVDPDEFLVFPYMETRSLRALTDHLEACGKKSFQTLLLDCYSNIPVEDTWYEENQDPLEICPWFDPYGYINKGNWYRSRFIQGGVRRRVFFSETPESAPALNKTPLVLWGKDFRFLTSTHTLYPRVLNRSFVNGIASPTGALLHFKFFSLLTEKVKEELVRGEHWNNSYEYVQYAAALGQRKTLLWDALSIKYENWQTLTKFRLMGPGDWF